MQHATRYAILIAGAAGVLLAVMLLGPALSEDSATPVSRMAPVSSPVSSDGGLPGRATHTPTAPTDGSITPSPASTLLVTSPFTLPTERPTHSPTPSHDCTTTFPIDSIEAIEFGQTSVTQLEASFGRADRIGGRPTQFYFEESGCTLAVMVAYEQAQEAELSGYGTLDWLVERYGEPEAVGVSEGNLVLIMTGYTVLLFPDPGIIAMFDRAPEDIQPDTPITTLTFRPAFEVDQQITRLNLRRVDWALLDGLRE